LSHNLLSAIWRPRKVSGVIQFQSKGLRTRAAGDVKSVQDWRRRERISQLKYEAHSLFFYLGLLRG
jgi:hypothetical protein